MRIRDLFSDWLYWVDSTVEKVEPHISPILWSTAPGAVVLAAHCLVGLSKASKPIGLLFVEAIASQNELLMIVVSMMIGVVNRQRIDRKKRGRRSHISVTHPCVLYAIICTVFYAALSVSETNLGDIGPVTGAFTLCAFFIVGVGFYAYYTICDSLGIAK